MQKPKQRSSKPKPLPFTDAQIRDRAYALWQDNPERSAEEHWQGAIEALKRERSPLWKVKRLIGLAFTAETPSEALDIVKVVVSTLGLLATVTAGVGLYLNYQQGQEKLVTDRFAKAVEQLGSKEIDVRIGAIYSLERIARDSPKDHWQAMEVLTAFVRNRSPLPRAWAPYSEIKLTVSTDTQSALTVLGRRDVKNDPWGEQLDFHSTYVGFTKLVYANLNHALFSVTDLRYASLAGAKLRFTQFNNANLLSTELIEADFESANL